MCLYWRNCLDIWHHNKRAVGENWTCFGTFENLLQNWTVQNTSSSSNLCTKSEIYRCVQQLLLGHVCCTDGTLRIFATINELLQEIEAVFVLLLPIEVFSGTLALTTEVLNRQEPITKSENFNRVYIVPTFTLLLGHIFNPMSKLCFAFQFCWNSCCTLCFQ